MTSTGSAPENPVGRDARNPPPPGESSSGNA